MSMLYPAMNKLTEYIPNRYMMVNVVARRARQIAELLLERYDAGAINAVHIIYTDMKNGLEATVRQAQVLQTF